MNKAVLATALSLSLFLSPVVFAASHAGAHAAAGHTAYGHTAYGHASHASHARSHAVSHHAGHAVGHAPAGHSGHVGTAGHHSVRHDHHGGYYGGPAYPAYGYCNRGFFWDNYTQSCVLW